jgi:PII-like signaling protein
VTAQGAKLTSWIGEHDRAGGRLLADALLDVYARHGVRTSCLLRGIEGFGAKHRLQSERLLSLSEDLPLVAVAVGARAEIERLRDEVAALQRTGLLTCEPVQLLDGDPPPDGDLAGEDDGEHVKLTVHLAREQRADGGPAHRAVVAALHDAGVAGATVLLGIDGMLDGIRARARFLARNARVPLIVVSVGERARIAAALPHLAALAPGALMTLEPVDVCKRDGVRLATPPAAPQEGDGGLERWQQLTVYASEQSRHDGETLHTALVRRLRAEGARGATALRGVWGYHGDHAPHGDRFWSVRRRVPVVTTVVDRAEATARWLKLVDACTEETGLVTSAPVSVLHAAP